jgi:hypothetical protein
MSEIELVVALETCGATGFNSSYIQEELLFVGTRTFYSLLLEVLRISGL